MRSSLSKRLASWLLACAALLSLAPVSAEAAWLSPETDSYTCLYDQLNTRAKAYYRLLESITIDEICKASTDAQGRRVVKRSMPSGAECVIDGSRNSSGSIDLKWTSADGQAHCRDWYTAQLFYRIEHPENMWMGHMSTSYSLKSTNNANTRWRITEFKIAVELTFGGQEKAMYDQMMANAKYMAERSMEQPDTYSRLKMAHDYLCVNNTYAYASDGKSAIPQSQSPMSYLPYSALIPKDEYDPVCTGYSAAFKIICNYMGIPCVTVNTKDHAWNNVKMDDGKWYSIDVTWDDTRWDKTGQNCYDYLLVGTDSAPRGKRFCDEPMHYQAFEWQDANAGGGAKPQEACFPVKSAVAYEYLGYDRTNPPKQQPSGTMPTILSEGQDPSASGTAYSAYQVVNVDGQSVIFQMYALRNAGGDTNYVKLRDLAYVLNGSAAQFNVEWTRTRGIFATSGSAYQSTGAEMSTPYVGNRKYTRMDGTTDVNGWDLPLAAFVLYDDAGGGYTYYKLRDLGQALGFNVGWSAAKGVYIETDRPYQYK